MDKNFLERLPENFEIIQSWSIYDLVDDWVNSVGKHSIRYVFLYLLFVLSVGGLLIFITDSISTFPDVSIVIFIFIMLLSLFVTIILHELCHGLMIIRYGGVPRFGAKWLKGLGPMVYATTEGYYAVSAYKNIASAPLVGLSLLCFVAVAMGYGWWVIAPFIFNAIGSGGDLLALRVLHRYPSNYYVRDTQDGFDIYRIAGSLNET